MPFDGAFDFIQFKQIMLNWPESHLPPEGCKTTDPVLGRLLQILRDGHAANKLASFPDFITLIRQLLMSRSNYKNRPSLRMPSCPSWPNPTDWRGFGFSVTEIAGQLMVEPESWMPDWLGSGEDHNHDVFESEFGGDLVRKMALVPMDPFLVEACGYETYVCPGQREAVRSVLFMPNGSSLIVNLPTGSGKTLAGLAPVLVHGLNSGLTLFIIPTTALALDLARRTRELLLRRYQPREIPELALHSGCSDEVKLSIKNRIHQGTQGILFTSPEAVAGSLLPALYEAATNGSLKYFVIDEAHLVDQWGDGFRPAFQQLSGIRRGLMRQCPGDSFRTILMSATFSKQTVETLDVLFGPSENLQMVSAVHLRPEPRFYSHKVGDWATKQKRVLELLKFVPRPFILYVTERSHASLWLSILNQEGYRRVASFHGGTPNSSREKIIDQFTQDKLDGIVATSAFGVGIDKGDVRTIIHAAVPETLDRFYQEVGRGGRDGRASLSIIVFDDDDVAMAKGMSKPTFIGDDNAFERWEGMFTSSTKIAEDLYLVDLTKRRPHLWQETQYNQDWNMRVLILLARAGMIHLDSSSPEILDRDLHESDEDYEVRKEVHWTSYFTTLLVRTLDPLHINRIHFEKIIGKTQTQGGVVAAKSFSSLMAALGGRKEMSEVLSKLFTSHKPDRMVIVSRACRGCPKTNSTNHTEEVSYQIPAGIGIEKIVPSQTDLWDKYFPWLKMNFVVVFYPDDRTRLDENIFRALDVFISKFGVKEVSASKDQWLKNERLRRLHKSSSDGILIARTLEEDSDLYRLALPLARATLLLPWENEVIPDHLLLLDRPLHVVFAPESVPSTHPLRRYQDDSMNHIHLNEFLRIATQ